MLARHCTLARVQQSRYETLKFCDFLWRTSSMFFLSLTGVKCMFQESCGKSGWWFLKLQKNAISIPHCRKIESTCPPSSMETTIPRCPPLRGDSNSQRPLSPISDSNLLWSKLDLAEERDRRNWPNWLVVSNIWVYESGIYPESTPFNGH